MNIEPVEDNILVQYEKPEDVTKGGILLPQSAKDPSVTAKVLAVGPGHTLDSGTHLPIPVKVGDTVVLAKVPGRDIKVEGVGECKMVKARDIMAVVRKDK